MYLTQKRNMEGEFNAFYEISETMPSSTNSVLEGYLIELPNKGIVRMARPFELTMARRPLGEILYHWFERSACAALGRCRQNVVATLSSFFFFRSGYFSPRRGCSRVLILHGVMILHGLLTHQKIRFQFSSVYLHQY